MVAHNRRMLSKAEVYVPLIAEGVLTKFLEFVSSK